MKHIGWKILLFIGMLPFLIVLGMGVFNSIFGFTFMFDTSYGINAFLDTLLIITFLFWPAYLVGIVLIIISSVNIKKQKRNK